MRLLAWVGIVGLVALTRGCGDEPIPTVTGGLEVSVAALDLRGVGDVVWDVEVLNGDDERVWERRLTSSRYGDGAGSASYVGSCDAEAAVADNEVRVWVVGVYASAVSDPGEFASGATSGIGAVVGEALPFENPTAAGPLTREVRCEENADAAVAFDVALMRPAEQGFFDIAISFGDVFCSAKFDCCQENASGTACVEPITLLFDEEGTRASTMVLGFACVAPAGGPDPLLLIDALELDCTSPSAESFEADLSLAPAGPAGNQCTAGAMATCTDVVTAVDGVAADDYLFQVAVFRGVEDQDSAGDPMQLLYWNIALGVREPAIDGCWLRTRGTADDTGVTDNGVVAAGSVYPYVQWEVDLETCMAEELVFGDAGAMVRADYAGIGEALAFGYAFGPGMPAGSFCAAACDAPPGECWLPLGACGAGGACEYVPRAAGYACTEDDNPCTVAACDGDGACVIAPGNAGATCRAAVGACDLAESCDGSSSACPADGLAAAGAECRASQGGCDPPELCDGFGADCPVDTLFGAGVVCRDAEGPCDIPETCDGATASCPPPTQSYCGECGAADGQSYVAAPTVDLCDAGAASAVGGEGPYAWSCAGAEGGADASCAADRSCAAGIVAWGVGCSFSAGEQPHGYVVDVANEAMGFVGDAELGCQQGSWETADATCELTVNAACGAAALQSTTDPPDADLCASGVASAVSGDGPFGWTCSGAGGGTDASCESHRSCLGATLSWASCAAGVGTSYHADVIALANTEAEFSGSATATCDEGSWSLGGTSCDAVVDGVCGTADGGSTLSAPAANLCAAGSASVVTGSGPFTWTCDGAFGGTTASCGSHRSCDAETLSWDTSCSASRSAQEHGFSDTLANTAAGFSGAATTSCSEGAWSLSGTSCDAIVNGACGTADGGSTLSAPSSSLCSAGSASSVTGTGPYSWTCVGAFGGTTASCSSHRSCPDQGLTWDTSCSAWNVSQSHGFSDSVANTAPGFSGAATMTCDEGNWVVSGTSCEAIINGACGAADGGSTLGAPSSSLCSAGSASSVTGSGPYSWTCVGAFGGTTASCSSHRSCAAETLSWDTSCSASRTSQPHGFSASLTNTATGYSGAATTSCSEGAWSLSGTSCDAIVNGACGTADGGSTLGAPSSSLCSAGSASSVTGTGPYSWTCAGAFGGTTASCSSHRSCATQTLSWDTSCSASRTSQAHSFSASLTNTAAGFSGTATTSCSEGSWGLSGTSCDAVVNGACGTADGGSTLSAPSSNLCTAGSASIVTGSGPYSWTCVGAFGGTTASCSSHRSCDAETLSWDASCSASRTSQPHGFSASLTNTATGYSGAATTSCSEGSWGLSGTSCDAVVNGACGTADGGSTLSAPASSLCSAGSASTVTGSGPYSWTCVGAFGGTTASCGSHRSCATQTLSWDTSCSASRTSQAHGFSASLTNTATGYSGAATTSCSEGVWSLSATSCDAVVNGACGTADGGSTLSAPSSNLCTAGSASTMTGSGPFSWTCVGAFGGTTASCSSHRSCATQTLSWDTSCSASRTSQAHGFSASLTNTAAGYSGAATTSCSEGAWSLSGTSCDAVVNGACGTADGGSTLSAPSSNLCSAGSASSVTGSGPYSWTCVGAFGGTTASCSSHRSCATQTLSWQTSCSASRSSRTHGFIGALSNTAPGYSGSATSTCDEGSWVLTGTSCQQVINATCGSAANGSTAVAPTAHLCATGTPGPVGGSGPYGWLCYGSGGGSTTGCQSNRSCVTTTLSWSTYCSVYVATEAHGYGATLSNTASGYSGGATVSCDQGSWSTTPLSCVEMIDGVCGAADGTSGDAAPTSGLCAVGAASSVTGSGPYTWTCSGSGGGAAASCTAHKSCALGLVTWDTVCLSLPDAADHGASQAITSDFGGYNGSATATCDEGSWALSDAFCTSCGPADGGSSLTAPSGTTTLCSSTANTMTPTAVTGAGPYTWSCQSLVNSQVRTDNCSSNRSCAAGQITWPPGCYGPMAADQPHGFSGVVANKNYPAYTKASTTTATCNQGTWTTSGSTCEPSFQLP